MCLPCLEGTTYEGSTTSKCLAECTRQGISMVCMYEPQHAVPWATVRTPYCRDSQQLLLCTKREEENPGMMMDAGLCVCVCVCVC